LEITVTDLIRALLNGGDTSAFSEVYSEALGGSPLPVIGRFGSPVRLPSPAALVDKNSNFPGLLSLYGKDAGNIGLPFIAPEIRLFATSDIIGPDGHAFANAIVDFKPDVIALESPPYEFSSFLVYVFSLACPLGLSAKYAVHRRNGQIYLDGSFQPDSIFETVVLESWFKRLPLLPVGSVPRSADEESSTEARYVISRILEIASVYAVLARKARVLAVVSPGIYSEAQYLTSSLYQDTYPAIYVPPRDVDPAGLSVIMESLESSDPQEIALHGRSPAAQRFMEAFRKEVKTLSTAPLTRDAATSRLIDIVARVRHHPDVVRGPSVRGTLAFSEILDSFSGLAGGLRRDCVGKAALITLPPRITVKQNVRETVLVTDAVKEVLYNFSFSGKQPDYEISGPQLPDNVAAPDKARLPQRQDLDTGQATSFTLVSGVKENPGAPGSRKVKLSKDDSANQYHTLKRAVMSMLDELKDKLVAGEITSDEYEHQKNALMSKFKSAVKPQLSMSNRELADTVIEMMDAQDKIWDKNISFSRMNVYYHVKGTSGKADLSPFKQDYHALQWVIDDLREGNILRPADDGPGFLLTGFALDTLLNYFTDMKTPTRNSGTLRQFGEVYDSDRSPDIRRYSQGDTFRDLSVRHTLKEIVRSKKKMSDVGYRDLRVFMKERRKPQTDIVFCIDTSGSMGFNGGLTGARLVAGGLARAALSDGNRAGVVAFNDNSQTKVSITGRDRDSVLNGIAGLSANGNTNIGDGIKSARELLLHGRSNNRKLIILLTDGQASAVSQSAFEQLKLRKERNLTEESAIYETRKTVDKGIRLSVVYLAPRDEAVESFISNLARIGKGKVLHLTGLSDLKTLLRN
jgi:Mg-chelatase subunit ChlD